MDVQNQEDQKEVHLPAMEMVVLLPIHPEQANQKNNEKFVTTFF
jgi:hypothetical protein